MKKKCITASMIMIAIALLINMLGFHIYADNSYVEFTNNWINLGNNGSDHYVYSNTVGVRLVRIGTSNTDTRIYAIYTSAFRLSSGVYTQTVNDPSLTNNSASYTNADNITYYYRYITSWVSDGYPPSQIPWFYSSVDGENVTNRNLAYYYTFGDGAIQTPTWGELEISYQQNILTNGNGALNEDIIRWNAYRDTAGNDLQGKNIEIQAIAGYFQGSDYADLKANNFTDWLNATHPAVTMYKGSIEKSYEVYEWGEVATNFRDINTLGMWFWNIFTSEDTWYQYGWRYQARLLDENLEPLTEWQLIYTGNSWSPSATETFTDDEPLTPEDVNTINDINDENGTTNNWYINNTYITNNEYNQQYQQNIIENIYNILQGQPDDGINHKAHDVQQTIDNAIDTEDNYMNDLETQLTDLELNDITTNNGLMKALRWVREVHHKTIEETELGGIVLTIMLIGLITYLIGRRNG